MNKLINHINRIYSFNQKVRLREKVSKGFLSENFILESRETQYFLKKYRYTLEEKIQSIHQVKCYFARKNIPVILPIKNSSTKSYFKFNEGFYALFPYINQNILNRTKVQIKTIRSIAEVLAKIHIAGKNAPISSIASSFNQLNKNKSLSEIEKIIAIIQAKKNREPFDTLALNVVELKKKLITKNNLTPIDITLPYDHLIHGDFQDQNFFLNENGIISHVFDWEKTTFAPRIKELLTSLEYIFIRDNFSKVHLKSSIKFIHHYHQLYPLTQQEIIYGVEDYYLRRLHSLWVETEHYINKSTRVDQFLETQFNSLKYLSKNKDYFTNLLLSVINNK